MRWIPACARWQGDSGGVARKVYSSPFARPVVSRSGGTGRRARLRGVWGNPWGFESPLRHQWTWGTLGGSPKPLHARSVPGDPGRPSVSRANPSGVRGVAGDTRDAPRSHARCWALPAFQPTPPALPALSWRRDPRRPSISRALRPHRGSRNLWRSQWPGFPGMLGYRAALTFAGARRLAAWFSGGFAGALVGESGGARARARGG